MERVRRATPATITNTWFEDGEAVDPGVVTITIQRADGTPLETAAATTPVPAFDGDENNLARSFVLAQDEHTDQLDALSAVWISEDLGLRESLIEIVGDFYFSLAELAATKDVGELDDEEKTPEKLARVRALAEQAFEDAASERLKERVAYVPRYARATAIGTGEDEIAPRDPNGHPFGQLRALRDIAEAATPGDAAVAVSIDGTGVTESGIYRGGRWARGIRHTIGFEYGHDRPSERIRQAVLTLAKNWLIDGPIDDRATSRPAGDDGGVVFLSTPGLRGAEFGIPEVDAALPKTRTRVRSVPVAGGLTGVGPSRLDFYR